MGQTNFQSATHVRSEVGLNLRCYGKRAVAYFLLFANSRFTQFTRQNRAQFRPLLRQVVAFYQFPFQRISPFDEPLPDASG